VWETHILREDAGSRFLFAELLEGTSAAEFTLTSHGTALVGWSSQLPVCRQSGSNLARRDEIGNGKSASK
jgi:hypothetical protein